MPSFPPFRLDVAEERLWKNGKLLAVRRKPFAILKYLVANPRRLVTHDELLEHVWAGVTVSGSALRTHMHELRQVLGEGVIETVIGRGYRFAADLNEADASEIPAVDRAGHHVPASDAVVGRSAELEALRVAIERANAGHRQICFVTGEPGIGKTTLIDELTRELEGRADVYIVRGHCVEQHGTPEAFLSVIEVLAQLRRSELGDRTLAALIRHAPMFLSQITHLVPDAQLEDVMRRARGGTEAKTVRELIEALEVLCAQHTIVIVLEDLQWSDVATIDLIALLGQRRERARLVVIGTSRRADAQTVSHPLNRVIRGLVARSGATAIALDRIAEDDLRRLVDLRFPGHAFPRDFIATIDQITGGTPLFVVSFLDDLVSRQMLAERDGCWRLTASLEDVAAHRPDSVRQLIDIQLDRLTTEEQRVLEAASVIGIEFPTALVAAALGASLEQVDELCDALARRALFLRRVGAEEWPDGTVQARYAVTHGLVQEVSLGRSSASRRQRYHRLIAERLDAAHGERAAEIAHVLATHYDNGGSPARAVHFYAVAAARSTLRFASRDALALYERAHDLIVRMPATPERDVSELTVLAGKAQSVIRNNAASIRAPLEIFEQMTTIARRLGDAARLSAALANLSVRLVTLAEYDRAEVIGAELDEIQRTVTLPPEVLAIRVMARGLTATWRGELVAGAELLERETSDTTTGPVIPGMIGATDPTTILLIQLTLMRWLLGEPVRAERDAQRSLERATANRDPYMLGHSYCCLARLRFLGRTSPHEIRELANAALAIPEAEVWHPQAALLVGFVDSHDHPLESDTLDALERSFRARTAELPLGTTYMGLLLACVMMRSGAHERAGALLDELLAFARTTGERVVEPELLRLRGELLAPTDPHAAAECLLEAITLARAKQSRAFQLRAALDLAALWQLGDRRGEALALVAEAVQPLTDSTLDVIAAGRLLAE